MKNWSGLILFAACSGLALPAGAAAGIPLDSLDPKTWHEPVRVRLPAVVAAHDRLRAALAAEDAARIAAAVADLRRELGPDVAVPEVAVDYISPPDSRPPNLAELRRAWLEDCARRAGRDPWDVALAALKAGRVPPRLRDSQRMAEAYLATASLLGAEAGAPFRERALAGLRYIRSCQAKSGVFGYPYDPKRTDRLGQEAARLVERGTKLGRTMVEGVWIVEDLDTGALQFDNGVCGLAMLEAHALTGEKEFLDSAVRAAEWTIARPLVANWNYNAFSARLLAGAYLVTKEQRFLDGARRKFELGVLPGQTETGRWFDPHNARTQYHAILATALADYVEALAAAGAPELASARRATTLALDNLAAQAVTFGASNVHEMRSLEAFSRGTAVLGRRPEWDRAVAVTLNVLSTNLREKLIAEVRHLPEPLPLGLLFLTAAPGGK
jgi:hypothetical protein